MVARNIWDRMGLTNNEFSIHNKDGSFMHSMSNNIFMSSSVMNRASNFKIGVECQIFVIVVFLTVAEFYNLGHIQGIIRVP